MPLLLFLIAAEHQNRFRRPLRFMILIAVFSLISIHSIIISGFLAVIYSIEYFKLKHTFTTTQLRKIRCSILLFLSVFILVILIIIPPNDLTVSGGRSLATLSAQRYGFEQIAIQILIMLSDAFISNILGDTITPIQILNMIMVLFVLAGFILLFKANNKLRYFLGPLLALLLFFNVGYFSIWHSGILFLLLFFVLWITYQDNPSRQLSALNKAFILIILLVQVYWSASAYLLDYGSDYSGSKNAARFLVKQKYKSEVVFGKNPQTTAILPYFQSNIFLNYRQINRASFWIWSQKNNHKTDILYIVEKKPELLVIGYTQNRNLEQKIKDFPLASYQKIGRFNGYIVWKDSIYLRESYLIYRLNPGYHDQAIPVQDIINMINLWQDFEIHESKEYKWNAKT